MIKQAFQIRSMHSHGNKINYSKYEIEQIAILMDDIVRKVLQKVLKENELSYNSKEEAKKVAEFFQNL